MKKTKENPFYFVIEVERGWFCIHARQIGYNALSSWYLAKSTLRSNNFIIKLWWSDVCGGGGGGGVVSFLMRFGGRPRLGKFVSFSSSSSVTFITSCRAPFKRPRAACTTSVAIRNEQG